MPNIRDVMISSLQRGVYEVVRRQATDDSSTAAGDATDAYDGASDAADSFGTTANEVSDTVTDVKTAFSSWDNCMDVTYCKWPVIAVIIIGGIIIFSVVWCIIRCACCGLSCCCSCFSCLKCCGNCCGCCDPPRKSKGAKYLEEPYIPPNQGYTSHPPMTTENSSFPSTQKSAPPQYAEFDVGKKGDDDALPKMPSWETAGTTKVMVEEGVELDQLKKNPATNVSQTNLPLMAGAAGAGTGGSVSPASPVSPSLRQQFPLQGNSNTYITHGSGNMGGDSYTGGGPGSYGSRGPSPYGQQQSQNQYTMGGAAGVPGRQSPYGNRNNYYGQQPQSSDSYGRVSPHRQDPYGQQMRIGGSYGQDSPRGQDHYDQQPTNPLDLGFQRSTSPQEYDHGYSRQPGIGGRLSPARPDIAQGSSARQDGGFGYDNRSHPPGVNNEYDNGGSFSHDDPYASHTQQGGYGYNGGQGQQSARQYPTNPQRRYTGDTQRQILPPQRQYTGDSQRQIVSPQRQYAGESQRQMAPPHKQYTGESQRQMAPPQRQYTSDSQKQMPLPQRQYTGGGTGPASGVDFSNGGYSQPQKTGTGDSYPGRRPYQPY